MTRTDESDSLNTGTGLSTNFDNCNCNNAVLGVAYTVYTNSNQNGISKITADIVIGTISSCDVVSVPQNFSVQFFTASNSQILSGSPGYVKGKPLLTAIQTNGNLQLTYGTKLYGRNTNGLCVNTNNPHSPTILYGTDTVFSCYNSFNLQELKSSCTGNVANYYIFSSQTITHVAKFGNIFNTNLDD